MTARTYETLYGVKMGCRCSRRVHLARLTQLLLYEPHNQSIGEIRRFGQLAGVR